MKDLYTNNDPLLDELENKFNNNEKQNDSFDDPFDIKVDYEENELYRNITNDSAVDISFDTKTIEPENYNTNANAIKKGRPKGSLKKVSREKIIDKKITISLSKEEKESLEKKAKEDDRSVSSFIRIKLKEAGVFK